MKKFCGIKFILFKVALIIFAMVLIMPIFTLNVFALNTDAPKIYCIESESDASVLERNYPTDITVGEDLNFAIKNFDFENGDVITYFYVNQNTGKIVYEIIDYDTSSEEKDSIIISDDITTENKSQITFNAFLADGAGTYKIIASVFRDDQLVLKLDAFTLNIKIPTDLVLTIEYKIIDTINELKTYELVATLKSNSKVIDANNYDITWNEDDGNGVFWNKPIIIWNPTKEGNYNIKASVTYGDKVVNSNTLPISVKIDNTNKVVLCLVGLAVLATLGVIISTAIKIKKERVW